MPGQPIQAQAPGPTDQGPAPEDMAGISYEELRARLPQEVGDDIVRLLANSAGNVSKVANFILLDLNFMAKCLRKIIVMPSVRILFPSDVGKSVLNRAIN